MAAMLNKLRSFNSSRYLDNALPSLLVDVSIVCGVWVMDHAVMFAYVLLIPLAVFYILS